MWFLHIQEVKLVLNTPPLPRGYYWRYRPDTAHSPERIQLVQARNWLPDKVLADEAYNVVALHPKGFAAGRLQSAAEKVYNG